MITFYIFQGSCILESRGERIWQTELVVVCHISMGYKINIKFPHASEFQTNDIHIIPMYFMSYYSNFLSLGVWSPFGMTV